jgi:predicted RNase H-like HicB family nuclease
MNDNLWHEAKRLASRNYRMDFERDVLSSGQTVYLARNPELPGCKAQGATVDEAKENLDSVRVDYIHVLLEEGLPIPEPQSLMVMQQTNVTVRNFSYIEGEIGSEDIDIVEAFDKVIQPEHREFLFGLTLGGNLVKQS